jgi:hypothetical protein
LPDPSDQAKALHDLAAAIAQAGDNDRARRTAAEAEAVAHTIPSPGMQSQVLASLVTLIAELGDSSYAARLAAQVIIMGPSDTNWVQAMSYFLPIVIRDSLNVLANAFSGTAGQST